MELTEKRILCKEVRKTGHKVGLGLFLAFIIELVALITVEIIIGCTVMKNATPAELDYYIENSAVSAIFGVLIGVGFLFLFFKPEKTHRQIFVKNKSMTAGWFAILTCIFLGCQIIFEPLYLIMEKGFNLLGFTSTASMEMATSDSTTVSMFIYSGLVAPVVEELIYRGFIMRFLGKYGKTFAIVTSSVLFGIMHGNLPQAVFATIVGLVLGYVATEYSIIWSIVLHMINNLVLGDLMSYALAGFSDLVCNIVLYSITGICLLVGVIAMIIKRKRIYNYLKENRWKKPYIRWIFTTVFMIMFILLHLGLGVCMIERIV